MLFHGQVDQLYARTDMRLNMTIKCFFCPAHFRSGDELLQHAEQEHQTLWRDSEPTYQFFRKLFFTRSGCLCNPGSMPGDDQHQCAALRQLAMLFVDFGMPICIPYAFKAQELVDLFYPLMSFKGMKEVTTHLMLRQFAKLWQHRELHELLKSTCLVCQEPMQLTHLIAHLEVAHDLPLRRYQYHLQQLAKIYVALQSDVWACDFCGAHLQIDEIDFGFAARAYDHLLSCPLLMHMAVLLGHPIWEVSWPDVVTWPDQATLLEQHRQRSLRMWQLNALCSDHPAAAYMLVAQCGKWYLDDPIIKDMLNNQCLICGKHFFSSSAFLHHLFDSHNFHQMDTELSHSLLEYLTRAVPCDFCGSTDHTAEPGRRCISLFNLSVFLCNSYGLPRGRGYEHSADHGSLEAHLDTRRLGLTQCSQARGERRIQCEAPSNQGQGQGTTSGQLASCHTDVDTTGDSARGLHQCPVDGESVPSSFQPRSRLHCGRDDQGLGQLATDGSQNGPIETSPGMHDDGDPDDPPDQALNRGGNRCDHQRLSEVSSHRCTGHHALPPMGLETSKTGALQRQAPEHWRNVDCSQEHYPTDARPSSHGEIPLPAEVGQCDKPIGAMDVDDLLEDQCGALERNQDALISRLLATDYDEDQTANDATIPIGPAPSAKRSLRVLLNKSGTACFINAALLGLAWLTLQCDGLQTGSWAMGFQLMWLLTTWSPAPIDVLVHEAFLELLDGETWGLADINKQQDLLDFLCFLLPVLMPTFLHRGWITRPALLSDVSDLRIKDEKGHRFQPLRLGLTDFAVSMCTLQSLVNAWHDPLGLCRAFEEDSRCKCIAVDRVIPPHNVKCTQKISLGDGTLQIPIFTETGLVVYRQFYISAVVFHIGSDSSHGHYRCAVRMHHMWYVYDDGRPPDQCSTLSDLILTQLCLVWIQHTPVRNNAPLLLNDFSEGMRPANAADDGQ